jgi:pyruvate dehydrogenase E2 component (dihydrolipoamide acetyltransferase)
VERVRELEQPNGANGESERVELTRVQRIVARRMAESKATVPEFVLSVAVDMTRAVGLRERWKANADPTPSYNDMIVKATGLALREHPRVNGSFKDGAWELHERVNVGFAVATPEALVVPIVFDADRKQLSDIAHEAGEAIAHVRAGTVHPSILAGGTFTVSNLGMYGIDQFIAIVNPPQAAILTVGALAKRPVVGADDAIVARQQLTLTLVCDHRIVYGADGAQFLTAVRRLLEEPEVLAA